VVEAQAGARPIVVTDAVGGIRQSVRPGETAKLVPVGQPQQMVEAIMQLANDDQLRVKMGKAGREYVRNKFSIETVKPLFLQAILE